MSTTATYAQPAPGSAHPHSSTSLEAKVVVLGSQNVGKTSLVHRYVHSQFQPGSMTPSTVGASFLTTRVHDAETDTTMRLQIWDTAGQERFRSISKLYYRGAHAAVLCYDITSRKSFEDMGTWLRELKDKASADGDDGMQGTILHIVGTKSDIVALDPSKREVPFERCIDFVASELYPQFAYAPTTITTTTKPGSAASRPGSAHDSARSKASPPMPTSQTLPTRFSPPLQQQSAVAPLGSPASTNRSSSVLWGAPDQVWDCCHEISAKDGEGIDEVFRVITRKLIERHHERLAATAAIATPWGMASAAHGTAGPHEGYFDGVRPGLAPGMGSRVAQGSFRLGHGNNRRSWLGLYPGLSSVATTPGFGGMSAEEEERLRMLEQRKGRCC